MSKRKINIEKNYTFRKSGKKIRKTIDKSRVILYYIGEIGNTGDKDASCLVRKKAGVALFFYSFY